MNVISSDCRCCNQVESIMMHKSIYVFVVSFAISISVGFTRPPKKIINGVESANIPFLVSLQTASGQHLCGGTILDATHILTAAHCVIDDKLLHAVDAIVVTGTPNRANRTQDNLFRIADIIIHEGYDPSAFYVNDIAILKLDRNISFTEYQYPLQLPVHNTPPGAAVVTSGWGATLWSSIHQTGDAFPKYVREAHGYVINQAMCRNSLKNKTIRFGQICFWAGGATPCNADSGGPLTDGIHIIGITSFNEYCDPQYPSVYTRVYHYLPWIEKALNHKRP